MNTYVDSKKITKTETLYRGFFTKLIIVLFNSLYELIFRSKNSTIVLPARILEYTLVRPLHRKVFPFATGLYQMKNGKFVVVKIWAGERKNIYYFNLVKEIIAYSIFKRVYKTIERGNIVYIPQMLGAYAGKNHIILVTQYLGDTTSFRKKSYFEQQFFYNSITQFFQAFANSITIKEKQLLGLKSKHELFWQLPIILAVSLFKRPQLIKSLLFAATIFYFGGLFIKDNSQTFVHGDLHSANLLVMKDGKVAVLDFEQSVISSKFAETFAAISSSHNSQKFSANLLNEEVLSLTNEQLNEMLYYFIFSAIYNLSSYKKNKDIKTYKLLLDMSSVLFYKSIQLKIFQKFSYIRGRRII